MTASQPPADEAQPQSPYPPPPPDPVSGRSWPVAPAATPGWSTIDLITGFATIVVLISLFLPWFTATVRVNFRTISGTISGTNAHGYLWVVFALALIVLLLLIAPDGLDFWPSRLPSHRQLLVAACGLNFLLVLLGMLAKPAGSVFSSSAGFSGLLPQLSATFGYSYGAFIGLVGAAVAFSATMLALRAQPSD